MKKTKTGISASMSSYQRVMARLERLSRRVDVVRGAPMSVKAIDAMEKRLRVKLGAEYRTFLQETGSLEVFHRKNDGAGLFVMFGKAKGRFDAPLFSELPYYQPHADFGRRLVVSCEFARFSREDTYGGDDDPFSEVQEFVLLSPDGEGFMDVRGVACDGGGFDTYRPEPMTFDEVFASFNAVLNDVDPRGAAADANDDAEAPKKKKTRAGPVDATTVESMLTQTIAASGAASLLFYVDGVELSADGKTATATVGINLPAGTEPEVAKEPYATALIAKMRAALLEEAKLTLKVRLYFEVLSPDYVEGEEPRHVSHLARLLSKLVRRDSAAETFLERAKSRISR